MNGRNKQKTKNLLGLLLIGGKSTRMKKDKASLNFHGQNQTRHAFELLQPYCQDTYISAREDQADNPLFKDLPIIFDKPSYASIGPLGGILSAMEEYPHKAWYVLAIDLPFLTPTTLEKLLKHRNSQKIATAFKSVHDGLPEPLCSIYEAMSYPSLRNFFKEGKYCPRKFLLNSDIELVEQSDKMALDNINHPEEYQQAKKILNNGT